MFLYRLDYNTLASWDEGWYASIARAMVQSSDWINMNWNGQPYYDHPPFGFWLIAMSYTLFGISEFTTRLPQAIMGILTTLFLYKTVVILFKSRAQAYATALVLATSVWYVIRVRSGNLDAAEVFFYVLTFYFAVKSSKNIKFFPAVGASFAALMLTKTLVGLPAIILIVLFNIRHLHPKNIRKAWPFLLVGIAIFIAIFLPWYYIHLKKYSDFWQHHFVTIGTRDKSLSSFLHISAAQPLFFLHMGIRKWYYFWLAAGAYLLISFNFLKKNIFIILLWNGIILYPFLTSTETQLWHLIPVYVPVAYVIAAGTYQFLLFLNGVITSKTNLKRTQNKLAFLYVLGFTIVALVQFKIFYAEVFPANKYTPDDVAISKKAATYNKPIFLDDDYLPIAVFYSGQHVTPLYSVPDDRKTMVNFFKSDEQNFVMITRNWAVEQLNKEKIPHVVLDKNNSFSIVSKP